MSSTKKSKIKQSGRRSSVGVSITNGVITLESIGVTHLPEDLQQFKEKVSKSVIGHRS